MLFSAGSEFDDIQAKIMAMLPSYASALNPIDATAQAIGEVGYKPMVELVRQSRRIDTILLISSVANETFRSSTCSSRSLMRAGSAGPAPRRGCRSAR